MKVTFTVLMFGVMMLVGGCRSMDFTSPTTLQLGGTGTLEIVSRIQPSYGWDLEGYEVHIDGKFVGRYLKTDTSFLLKAGERTVRITPVPTKDWNFDPPYIERTIFILGDDQVQGFRAVFNVDRK